MPGENAVSWMARGLDMVGTALYKTDKERQEPAFAAIEMYKNFDILTSSAIRAAGESVPGRQISHLVES